MLAHVQIPTAQPLPQLLRRCWHCCLPRQATLQQGLPPLLLLRLRLR